MQIILIISPHLSKEYKNIFLNVLYLLNTFKRDFQLNIIEF